MSNPLAISGVTAVLHHLLSDAYNHPATPLGNVHVSSLAPDLVQTAVAGAEDTLRVNIFLHQVTLNAALRNIGLPSLAADGRTVLKTPPLALDLHYLLTVYASQHLQAEALLGYGVQVLHENPTIPRQLIDNALAAINAADPLKGPIVASGLSKQIELIKITPATLGGEEIAWLWTALKADYRPTFPFQVSVVLIAKPAPTLSALPVLQRNITAQNGLGPLVPTLVAIVPPDSQPAAGVGKTVTVQVANVPSTATALTLQLSNSRAGVQSSAALTAVSPTSMTFTMPNVAAGFYVATVQFKSGSDTISTNSLPLIVAPIITSGVPASVASGASVTITFIPEIRVGQEVSLLIGGQGAPLDPPPVTAIGSATFVFPSLQPMTQAVPVWLRVDGVDGPIMDLAITAAHPQPTFAQPTTKVN